jgi:hypothetical protein
MLLVALFACGPEGLEDGFEGQITQGWVCQGGDPGGQVGAEALQYTALDADATFRFSVWLPVSEAEATFPDDPAAPLGHTLFVVTGEDVVPDQGDNKCDDVVVGSTAQVIEVTYVAVEGTVSAVQQTDGIGLQVDGLVLRPTELEGVPAAPGWEDLPEVAVESATLPAF